MMETMQSVSGYVISALIVILTALLAYMGKRLDTRLDQHGEILGTLDKTVAVLDVTVKTLQDAIGNLRK